VFSTADIAAARASLQQHCGWCVPAAGSSARALYPADLTVALATRLQHLTAHVAISQRHAAFIHSIAVLEDLQQPAPAWPPSVTSVVARWWRLHVPNTCEETAWRLTLNAFPKATQRMLHSVAPCPACGVADPGQQHYLLLILVLPSCCCCPDSKCLGFRVYLLGFR
jgi:hypothetical protein